MRPIQRYLLERGEFAERIRQEVANHSTVPVKMQKGNYEGLSPEYIAMSYAEGEEVFNALIKQYRKYKGPEDFSPSRMSKKDYDVVKDHLRLPVAIRDIKAIPKYVREKAGDLMVSFGTYRMIGEPDQGIVGAGFNPQRNLLAFPKPDRQAENLKKREDVVTAKDIFAHEWVHFKQAMTVRAALVHDYHPPIAMYNAAPPVLKWALDFTAKRGNQFMFMALTKFGIYVYEKSGRDKSPEFYKMYYNDPQEREAFSGMVASAYHRMYPQDMNFTKENLLDLTKKSPNFYRPFIAYSDDKTKDFLIQVMSRYKLYQRVRVAVQDAAAQGMKPSDIRKKVGLVLTTYKVPKSTFSDWVQKGRNRKYKARRS